MAGAPPSPPDPYDLAREIAEIKRDMRLLAARRIPASSLPNELLESPVAVDAKSDNTGVTGVALGTAGTDYATVEFAVPAGYTQAIITATSGVFWGGTCTGITVNTKINGNLGYSLQNAVSFSNGFAANSVTLTELTDGETLSVSSTVSRTADGTADAYIVTTAWVTYLR